MAVPADTAGRARDHRPAPSGPGGPHRPRIKTVEPALYSEFDVFFG
nr:hypothetical protein [Streptomyces sp. 846.5]